MVSSGNYQESRGAVGASQASALATCDTDRSSRPLDGKGPVDMSGFRVHESPKGHFYADPFVVEYQGKHWLFFEDFLCVRRKGVLACAELLPDGSLSAARAVLERTYHLSYPCVFEADGALYMIPESLDNGTVDLYRCASFPDRWSWSRRSCEARLSTARSTNGTAITGCGPASASRANAKQLCLFLAPDLLGPWTRHPASPLSNDVRNNRCAGAMRQETRRLLRVFQDCSRVYGYSFTFHEVTKLSPYDYEERAIKTIEPTWTHGLTATHTYGRSGGVEVVDFAVRRPATAVEL